MSKILSVGEIIWDIYPDKRVIGGAPLNFAAHTSKCGADSCLISAVGADMLGKQALESAKSFGMDCRYIKVTDFPTGQCIVTLDKDGVPAYNVLKDVAYDNISITDNDLEQIEKQNFDALYFGTLIQRCQASRAAVKKLSDAFAGKTVFCDVNLRPDCFDKDSCLLCLSSATVLKVSIEEEPLLRAFTDYTPVSDHPAQISRAICEKFNFETLEFQSLEGVIKAIGLDPSDLCTYCWSGKE